MWTSEIKYRSISTLNQELQNKIAATKTTNYKDEFSKAQVERLRESLPLKDDLLYEIAKQVSVTITDLKDKTTLEYLKAFEKIMTPDIYQACIKMAKVLYINPVAFISVISSRMFRRCKIKDIMISFSPDFGMGSPLPYAIVEVPIEYITKHEDGRFSGRPTRSHISHNDTISKPIYEWFDIFHEVSNIRFFIGDDSARHDYWKHMNDIAKFYVNMKTIEMI